jgi:hypothetical protein
MSRGSLRLLLVAFEPKASSTGGFLRMPPSVSST